MTPQRPPLRCLCCDKPVGVEPSEAVIFEGIGTYGSRVFDVPARVQACVCDDCFVARIDRMIGVAERDTRVVLYYDAKIALQGEPAPPAVE